jgi:hypothetical protein
LAQDEAENAREQKKKQHDEDYYPSRSGIHAISFCSMTFGGLLREKYFAYRYRVRLLSPQI